MEENHGCFAVVYNRLASARLQILQVQKKVLVENLFHVKSNHPCGFQPTSTQGQSANKELCKALDGVSNSKIQIRGLKLIHRPKIYN